MEKNVFFLACVNQWPYFNLFKKLIDFRVVEVEVLKLVPRFRHIKMHHSVKTIFTLFCIDWLTLYIVMSMPFHVDKLRNESFNTHACMVYVCVSECRYKCYLIKHIVQMPCPWTSTSSRTYATLSGFPCFTEQDQREALLAARIWQNHYTSHMAH